MKIITYITIFTLFFTISNQAQTKSETEDFIKKYIEAYPQNNGITGEQSEISFKKTEKFGYCIFYSIKIPNVGHFFSRFEPKDIQSVVIDKKSVEGSVTLRIKLKNNKYGAYGIYYGKLEKENSFNILIGNSSINDQIPQRLKKSIEHLSNLVGGNITVDKF